MWGTPNPKKEGWYLCTIEDEKSARFVMPLTRCEYPKGGWTWHGLSHGKVIASIRFPKPCKKMRHILNVMRKIAKWYKKRKLRKACGMNCGSCPFLKGHWSIDNEFMGLSCRKGLW